MIRAFLAVPIPSRMCLRLAALQTNLREVLPPIRWVEPESIHLTLRFLGGVEAPRIAEIEAAIAAVAQRIQPFECEIRGLGGFPNLQVPRVLWVGVQEGRGRLEACVREIESATEAVGFDASNVAYHPHLTLARVRTDPREVGRILTESGLADTPNDVGRLRTDRITLFESVRGPLGATYSPLAEFTIGG